MIKFIIDNFAIISGIVLAFKWIYEYSKNRKFEKNKFLLDRIEKFYALKSVSQINKILDWNAIQIEMGGNLIPVTDEIVMQSLITHDKKSEFTEVEVYLRGIFDEYFDELNELIILSKCDLIDSNNLRKFLIYWVKILNGQKKYKPSEFTKVIDEYLVYYNYDEVRKFINQSDKISFNFMSL